MPSFDPSSRSLRQLRVLSGPMRGSVHPVGSQLHIGRAGSSDIQLMDDDVSRQHAEVVENVYGDHVLVDLDSANGTLINGEPIRRVCLTPGTVFEVMRTKFIYEEATANGHSEHNEHDERPPSLTDIRSLRPTNDYGALDLPAPVFSPHRRSLWGHANAPGQANRCMRAIDCEGVAYEGDLISDVREYRRLLSRSMRGQCTDDMEYRRLEVLESRLRVQQTANDTSLNSSFRRFYCSVPTQLRFAVTGSIPAVVIDFGVDGAQILSYRHGLAVSSVVWLSLDIVVGGYDRTVVFTSRVQWSSNNYAGLLFSGEPIQSEPDRQASRKATKRDLREQADAIRAALGPLELRRSGTR